MKAFTFILMLLLFPACETELDLEAERQTLLATDRDFAAMSVREGAAKAFNQFLADRAIQLPAGRAPVFGRETIYRQMVSSSDSYVLNWDPQHAELAASGDMGWTWGTYVLSTTGDDNETAESHGKYLNVWEKQDDGFWRVVVDMGNENPEPK